MKIVELPGLADGEDIYDYVSERPDERLEDIATGIGALAGAVPFIPRADLIGGPVLVCMASVKRKKIAWLWPARIPMGRITLFVGRPGEGKSFATCDFAARVTTGTPWPDGAECPTGSVIFIVAEDDAGDTIGPRLDAHYADSGRVHLLSMVRKIDDDGKAHDVLFTLEDVRAMEDALKAHPDCKLVVVDPIGSFLGGDIDAHRDNEVRSILAPVAKLAESTGRRCWLWPTGKAVPASRMTWRWEAGRSPDRPCRLASFD